MMESMEGGIAFASLGRESEGTTQKKKKKKTNVQDVASIEGNGRDPQNWKAGEGVPEYLPGFSAGEKRKAPAAFMKKMKRKNWCANGGMSNERRRHRPSLSEVKRKRRLRALRWKGKKWLEMCGKRDLALGGGGVRWGNRMCFLREKKIEWKKCGRLKLTI